MKKTTISVIIAALALFPLAASAHERQSFEINGVTYDFVVGSLGEPIVVDDKTGIDLRVSVVGHEQMGATDHHAAGGAVAGLEETLKVELIAGDKKKVMDILPVYNTPGSYKNAFFPTVATTLSYRVFGTVNDTPFDYTFTCSPAGHASAPEDKTRVAVSDGVVRVLKTGAFSCPLAKADLGFPEMSKDIVALKKGAESGDFVAWGAFALALAALATSVWRRRP